VGHHSEAFIGIDTSKLRNAVAIAEGGRDGEVRYLGEIDTTEAATQKLVATSPRGDGKTVCLVLDWGPSQDRTVNPQLQRFAANEGGDDRSHVQPCCRNRIVIRASAAKAVISSRRVD
jgi:hypothetical protein